MLKKFLCHPFCHVLIILLFGTLAYANSFGGPFVLDDLKSIANNEIIRDLGNFLPGGSGHDFIPRRWIGYFSFALNYHFSGLDVTGYHLFNLAVHLGTALLVYTLVRLTFRTPKLAGSSLAPQAGMVALLTALLFVAHPVQTQAVTYIVQRLASLCTFFYLLALVLYVAARLKIDKQPPRAARWQVLLLLTGAVVATLLAMQTKEIAFTLPLIIAFYEVSFFHGTWRRRALYLLPLLLTLPLIPYNVLFAEGADPVLSGSVALEDPLRAHTDLPRSHYLFTQFRVIVTYLRLLVWPTGQNLDYNYPVFTTFFTPPVLLSFLLLLALFALAVYLYGFKRNGSDNTSEADHSLRFVAFGIVCFFLTLSVESGLIPLADVISEHRLYLPSVGFFMAVAGLIVLGAQKVPQPIAARCLLPAVMLVIALLTAATWQRNQVWQSTATLWSDVIRKSPAKPRPWYNLGTHLIGINKPGEAIPALRQAVKLDRDYGEAWHNLGRASLMLGRFEQALFPLRQAVRIDPEMDHAVVNLSIALITLNQPKEAVSRLERIRQKHPELPYVRYNLGLAYLGISDLDGARKELAALNRIDLRMANSLAQQISQTAPAAPSR